MLMQNKSYQSFYYFFVSLESPECIEYCVTYAHSRTKRTLHTFVIHRSTIKKVYHKICVFTIMTLDVKINRNLFL